MKDLFYGFIGGLTFESTLPVEGGKASFEAFIDRLYLYPVLGAFLGGLVGIVGVGLSYLPGFIGASLAILVYYALCGIIHSDGLTDLADGLAAGGAQEERTKVMKDEKTGAAGLVGILVVNLVLFSGLVELFATGEPVKIFFVILIAEVLSKETMLSLLFLGESAHEGLGSTFIEKAGVKDFLLGTGFTGLALAWLGEPSAFLSMALVVLAVPLFVRLGETVAGGTSGDVIGAGGEFVRPLAIVSLVLLPRLEPLVSFW
jgi:adenosylcobinamide-GDP ribazoletransferase